MGFAAPGVPVLASEINAVSRSTIPSSSLFGGTLQNIASLTVYVRDVAYHRNYLKMLTEEFSGWRPAERLLQVEASGLPELLVEIQAIAVV